MVSAAAAACGDSVASGPTAEVGGADLLPAEVGAPDVGFAELLTDRAGDVTFDGTRPPDIDGWQPDADTAVEPPQQCQSNADCPSGICVQVKPDSDLGVCTETCITDESCPKDWVCKLVYIDYPDVLSVCIPPVDTLCGLCTSDADCLYPGSLCITEGEAYGYCGRACSIDSPDCPDGYQCAVAVDPDGEEIGQQCMPAGGCCDAGKYVPCEDDNECTLEKCHPTLGCQHEFLEGPCSGDEPCTDYQCTDGECVGTPITVDVTPDGVDDDCDGQTDEDVLKNPTLSGGTLGSCGGTWKAGKFVVTGVLSAPPYAGTSQSGTYRVVSGALAAMGKQ
jgi:hypothetical protein